MVCATGALNDLKNLYPVKLARHSLENKTVNKPSFAWWVPYTIRKMKAILSKIESKCW